jgi:hypothetical protein
VPLDGECEWTAGERERVDSYMSIPTTWRVRSISGRISQEEVSITSCIHSM